MTVSDTLLSSSSDLQGQCGMSLDLIGAACVETRSISLVQHSRGVFPEAKLTLYLSCILSE